jgi:hypothetical protein
MDFAALFPGDWNHVLFQTYHEFNYRGYSRAGANQSWYYEADAGENMNGFNYYATYVLGYQMPNSPVLDMVALMAEADLYLYETDGREKWGDDRIRWTFSSIWNFTVSKHFGITVLAQLRTMRNFTQPGWKDLYYQNRTINTDDPIRLEFYRVAGVFTYRF